MKAEYQYQNRSGGKYLTGVTYSDGTQASYNWDNGVFDDPHYAGPMRRIKYTGSASFAGEYKPPGTLVSGVPVQDDDIPGNHNHIRTRTETRGDGATRTFTYNWYYLACVGGGGELVTPHYPQGLH